MLAATKPITYPRLVPRGWGWHVEFDDQGSIAEADDGGPLTYRECGAAIDRWRRERERVKQLSEVRA